MTVVVDIYNNAAILQRSVVRKETIDIVECFMIKGKVDTLN